MFEVRDVNLLDFYFQFGQLLFCVLGQSRRIHVVGNVVRPTEPSSAVGSGEDWACIRQSQHPSESRTHLVSVKL